MLANMYGMPGTNNPNANGSFTDYVIVPIDDVLTRRYRLPTKDEAGQPKTYTDEERKQLKGDDATLIGYTASFDDLKVGQTVRVSLARKRTDAKDPDKVSYVSVNTLTGTIQKLDATSNKQFTLRVRGATTTTPAYGVPRQQQQKKNTEVPAEPDKFATLIVMYSDDAPATTTAKK
jgi:hypothetical protein